MTQPTNNAKKVAISNAVVRKLKLPNSLLNNQLFGNGAYSGYCYSNYYYHRYINKKICNDAIDIVEFNFAQFFKKSDVSQFLSVDYSQNKKDAHIEITSEISKSAKGFARGKLYKRELFDKVRFPEGLYWEDAIIGNIVLNMANTYAGLNKVGYLYRTNPNSISSSLIKRNLGYDQLYVIRYCLEMAKKVNLNMDSKFYKRLFLEASVFLNNRTRYLSDSNLSYIFNELEPVFQHAQIEAILTLKEKRMYETMKERNIEAWRAIAY